MAMLRVARSWRQSFLSTILIGLSFGVVLELGQAFSPRLWTKPMSAMQMRFPHPPAKPGWDWLSGGGGGIHAGPLPSGRRDIGLARAPLVA